MLILHSRCGFSLLRTILVRTGLAEVALDRSFDSQLFTISKIGTMVPSLLHKAVARSEKEGVYSMFYAEARQPEFHPFGKPF